MTAVHDLRVDTIVVGDRLRPIADATVAELAQSMVQVGLIHPIMIARPDGTIPKLVSGAHRLEAARRLGWETIACVEYAGASDDHRKLVEIDENLTRGELSPAERAIHMDARKEIYERLNPTTKQGGAPGKSGGGKKAKPDKLSGFAVDTAQKTGRNERDVRRDTSRAKKVVEISKVVGTSLDKGEELDALAKLLPERQSVLIDRARAGEKVSAKTELKKQQRDCKEELLGRAQLSLPDKRYGVILADPEWRFEPRSRETGLDRAADNHYPTSATDDIAARDVAAIAAADCALFLWATVPMLPDALRVMAAWGFTYRSHTVWRKSEVVPGSRRPGGLVLGTGYWFRNGHELLLVGTRGHVPPPAPGTQWPSMFDAPPMRHSQKPDTAYELIEAYFPTLPKIELNARRARPGWDAWGFEAPDQAGETNNVIGLGAGASIPPDIGIGVVADDDPPVKPGDDDGVVAAETAPVPSAPGLARPEASGDDELDIPNFLRRGHPDNAWAAKGGA